MCVRVYVRRSALFMVECSWFKAVCLLLFVLNYGHTCETSCVHWNEHFFQYGVRGLVLTDKGSVYNILAFVQGMTGDLLRLFESIYLLNMYR